MIDLGLLGRRLQLLKMALAVSLVGMFGGPSLSGAEALSPPTPQVFCLKHQADGFSFSFPVDVPNGQVAFRKEPDFGSREIVHGLVQPLEGQEDSRPFSWDPSLVQTGEGPEGSLGLAWDPSAGRLYVDLNRNLDLTDDPAGVFESVDKGMVQRFRDIRVEVTRGSLHLPYVTNLQLSQAPDRHINGWVEVRSGWQGEIVLNGKKCFLAVADNMDGVLRSEDRFSLTAAADAVRLDDWISVPQTLFWDGHCYGLAFEFAAGQPRPELVVTWEEKKPTLGPLRIEGKLIRRLVLKGNGTEVILDSPGEKVSLPVGSYRLEGVSLDPGRSQEPLRADDRSMASIPTLLRIVPGQPAILKVGGPLKHHPFLLLVVIPANRSRPAWWVLIPWGMALVAWRLVSHLLTFVPSGFLVVFGHIADTLALALVVLWLVGPYLGHRRRRVTFMLAAVLMAATGMAHLLLHRGMDLVMVFAAFYGLAALSLLIGLALAGFSCRQHYWAGRFLGWLILGFILPPVTFLGVAVMAVELFSHQISSGPGLIVFAQAPLVGGLFGGIVYLMALPFMLLALRSPFYRERFYGCFRLPGMGEQEGGAGEPKGNSWPARERESRGVGGD